MRWIMTAVYWWDFAVYIAGLLIGLLGFRKTRDKGFLVITVYFALAASVLISCPHSNQMTLEDTLQQEVNVAIQDAINTVLEKHGRKTYAEAQNVSISFAPIVLVTGLWMLTRQKKMVAPKDDNFRS